MPDRWGVKARAGLRSDATVDGFPDLHQLASEDTSSRKHWKSPGASEKRRKFIVQHAKAPEVKRCILAEGAIALSVTLSGGALFAS